MSCFMFRGWLQFYFNNLALLMLGFPLEKMSRGRFVVFYFLGIIGGNLFSCAFGNTDVISTGTSCGTICLIPL